MKDRDTKGQEQLIRNLKERLHWYAYECEPEEFNEKEVRTIVDLLKQLDPIEPAEYFNAEKGLERFWKYYEQRMEEEEYLERRGDISILHTDMEAARDMDVLEYVKSAKDTEKRPASYGNLSEAENADKAVHGTGRGGSLKRRFIFFRRHKAMTGTVAAAALVVLAVFGGTFGAYAERDTGFFHWISRDETSVKFITSPEPESGDINAGVNGTQRYNNLDEVPSELLNIIWVPEKKPNELELKYIDVMSTSGWKRYISAYKSQDELLHVDISVKIFDKGIVIHRQTFADYDYLYTKEIDDIEMEFFKKESDDEIEYAVCFYGDTELYSIQGNLSEEDIELLAINYAQFIF